LKKDLIQKILSVFVQAACMRCHGTRRLLLTPFFLSLSLSSAWVTFLPEGVIIGF
jgi:hypothetical protein